MLNVTDRSFYKCCGNKEVNKEKIQVKVSAAEKMKERKGVSKNSLEYETILDYLNKNTDLLEKYVRDNVSQEMLEKWLNEKRGKNNRNLTFADKSLMFDLKETEDADLIGWFPKILQSER